MKVTLECERILDTEKEKNNKKKLAIFHLSEQSKRFLFFSVWFGSAPNPHFSRHSDEH